VLSSGEASRVAGAINRSGAGRVTAVEVGVS
jgi:hypothetical protein